MFLYFIWYVISLPEQAPPPCLPHWTPHRDTLTVPRDMIPDPPSRITSSSYSRRHLAARVPAQQDGARRRAPCSRGVALRSISLHPYSIWTKGILSARCNYVQVGFPPFRKSHPFHLLSRPQQCLPNLGCVCPAAFSICSHSHRVPPT